MTTAADTVDAPGPASANSAGGMAAPVSLGGRVEIMPGTPLADLNGPGGPAFLCQLVKDRRTELYATVCTAPVPPRLDVMTSLRAMEHPSLLRLIDWGTVDWTPEGRRRFVVVMERPGVRRLMEQLSDLRDPLPEELISRCLLPQMLSLLRDASSRGVVLGAVRPTNMYLREAGSGTLVLGDCASVPVGYGQPALVEPIERAMAQPAGRGPGSIADDLYSLGVSLLVLLFGRNPLRTLDDEGVLTAKLERGTYAALTAQFRVPANLVEPLRGLTIDDPRQRWTLPDLDMWVQGRRLSPKQPFVPKRGARPLEFANQELWHLRSIARALTRAPAQAAPLIERGELDKWLRRSLGDEAKADQVLTAMEAAGGGVRSANREDRMVARAAIALDPAAPLRYRGVAVMPGGLGPALAEAMATGDGVQALAEMVLGQFVAAWVNGQPEFRADFVPLAQASDEHRAILEQTGFGFGIERLLYEMNPTLACQSPLVRDRAPLTPADLLTALDQAAAQAGRGRDPMDRHIAAFIATHHKKLPEKLLAALGTNDPLRRPLVTVAILGEVQRLFGPAKLPDLCAQLAGLLDPALQRYKNRETRERLKEESRRIAQAGVVETLLRLVDDGEGLRRDERDFSRAVRRYDGLTRDIERLRKGIADRDGIVVASGRPAAVAVSAMVSLAVLVVVIVAMVGGR